MKNVYLLRGFAALAIGLIMASCGKEEFEQQPTEAEAVTIAEEVFGFNIDPNQDWNMTQSGSIDVTVNAGIDANEVLILDAMPYGGKQANILGQTYVEEGQTYTVSYIAPKALESVYVACRNAQNKYRFVYVNVGTPSVSFDATTRGMASRRDGAKVSVDEEGYNTFNSELALSWAGVIAAESTGTPSLPTFEFMAPFVPWKNSGWTDKFHQISAPVVDSGITPQEASDLAYIIKSVIPEGENNLEKAASTGYTIITTGGPVTLTPIFKNSNSGDRISYYYYPKDQTPTVEQIKAMKKYTIGEMADPYTCNEDNYAFDKKTYTLVYERPDGSFTDEFPDGLAINFIISNTWIGEKNYKDIYVSGGETTEGSSLNSIGKFAIPVGASYEMGHDEYNSFAHIKFGNTMALPKFKAVKEGSTFTTNHGTEFKYYTEGNGVNGGLLGGGTAYYFVPKQSGTMTVGVSLAGGKTLKVVKMSTNQINQATSGDEVHTFTNPDQKNSYNGTITFNAEEWKLYCVYAEGSELGYYGFEFVDGNNTVSNHALPQGQVGAEYDFGQYFDFAAQVYMGKTPAYFATATAPSNSNSQVSGYTAYTTGALGNGGLTGGATTYYIQPYIEGVMRVAVVLNADKRFYIKDLGDNWDAWNNTSGTSVQNYDGITVSSKYYGTYDFHVQANHVYAIYAEGSRLGFYGCELLQETGGSGSSSTITDVVTKKIDTFQDYYGDGRMNVEVHQSELWGFNQYSHGINEPETPHCAIFEFAGRTFVGFEDWVDFDYNDVIYEITGAEGGEELTPDDVSYPIYSYAFEDSRNCDYDMNDVVIKATEDGDDIVLKLVAAGATLELYVRIYNYDENSPSSNYYGKSLLTTLTYNYQSEVHAMMGAESGYMINTNADNGYGCNANPIEIRLKKADYGDYRRLRMAIYIPPQKGKDAYEMRLSGSGTAPYGVIIPEDWKWPREWVNVKNAYSEFQGFAETAGANEEWYKKPTLNTVMDEKGFY